MAAQWLAMDMVVPLTSRVNTGADIEYSKPKYIDPYELLESEANYDGL